MSLFCQNCSNEVASQYKFCPACGNRNLSQLRPISQMANAQPTYKPLASSFQTGVPIWQAQGSNSATSTGTVYSQTTYAGFWRRVLAYLIDSMLLAAVDYSLSFILKLIAPNINQEEIGVFSVLMVISILTYWIYQANMESGLHQATWGKRAMGLRVCDLNGNRISFGRASGRFFASGLSALCLGIGFLMVAFTKQKQGLHDKIAKTLVLRTGE